MRGCDMSCVLYCYFQREIKELSVMPLNLSVVFYTRDTRLLIAPPPILCAKLMQVIHVIADTDDSPIVSPGAQEPL